jgi:RNA polymerase sigma-B factor
MPSTTEIADSLHVDEKAVDHAMLADQAYSAASLNAPTRRDDTGSEVGDLIGERDEQVDLVPDRMSLGPALDRLPSRERWILHLRFVDDLSQTDIADRIGLSQMHVSRIISRTLSGLRAWIDGDCDHVDTCHQRRAARQAG